MAGVVIFGAGGIIGQHMLIQRPHGARFFRQHRSFLYESIDLTDENAVQAVLDSEPDVILNLAGENRVDVVENYPDKYTEINAIFPAVLAMWGEQFPATRIIQASTQGIFSGDHPPYDSDSLPDPKTRYGMQKVIAEQMAILHQQQVVRITFVLGVRPFKGLGRMNPMEQMLSADTQQQVDNRWFSPAFASDVAKELWNIIDNPSDEQIIHLGVPEKMSRYDIAMAANPTASISVVKDEDFPGTPRPVDTTWSVGSRFGMSVAEGIMDAQVSYQDREGRGLSHRARELALFLDRDPQAVEDRLNAGFHAMHAAVAEDFRAFDPQDDDQLLQWYQETEAYIWELSAYHLDEGFNYTGMCTGIAEKLKANGKEDILVLGDGIGDLTMTLHERDFNVVYHDLGGSRTAEFAMFRHHLAYGSNSPSQFWTQGWDCDLGTDQWDAVIALDFMEHLPEPEVARWSAAVTKSLRTGGYFVAQNAFACGDDEHGGSIPMHIAASNHYEFDWLPLLAGLGYQQDGDIWHVKL